MFSYAITIYESTGNTSVAIDSLSQTFKIDESLDSAVLTIPRSTRKANFNRFSPVKIQVTESTTTYTYWWLIYTSKSELESFGITARYTHTLALIEPTKMLEKYICGSLTFTQPLGGTQYTLKGVVDRILLLTPFVKYADVSTTRVVTLNTTLASRLNSVPAPQLYLDKKNLREALIEVFKYINAIPRITFDGTNWQLTADFINNRHLNIDVDSGVLDYLNEADSNEFATSAEVYHENTIPQENEDSASVFANSITNAVTFRDESNLIVGEDRFVLSLPHKIYKLISVTVKMSGSTTVYETDITGYIPEKKVYDTLEFDNSATNYYGSKRCSAFWTYGSNVIDGFDTAFGIFSTDLPIENIIQDAVLKDPDYGDTILVNYSTAYEFISFVITYIPYVETDRSEQYREDVSDNTLPSSFAYDKTAIIINPSERINSLYRLTKNVYGQIQRLGVNTVSFALKHKTLAAYNGSNNGVYSLGDYTDDGYFITTVEIIYFTTYVVARYEMSKNFNRMAQFISIDKEFRPYEITLTKSDYTLKRDIVIKLFYCEISTSSNAGSVSNNLTTSFMNTLKNSAYDLPVSSVSFKCGSASETYPDNGVLMPLVIMAEKNTIKFKLDFKDTKNAGKLVSSGVNLVQRQVNYTEEDGTIDFMQVAFYKNYWELKELIYATYEGYARALNLMGNSFPYIDTTKNVLIDTSSVYDDNFITAGLYDSQAEFPVTGVENAFYVDLSFNRVYQYTTALGYTLYANAVAIKNDSVYTVAEYELLKDKSEIPGLPFTIPITVKSSEVNRFVIGDMLSKDNVLVKARAAKTLYIQSKTTRYEKADTENTGSVTAFTTLNPAWITSNYIDIPTNVQSLDNYAITDVNGNLYLAVNQKNLDGTKTTITRIYFNFVDERS